MTLDVDAVLTDVMAAVGGIAGVRAHPFFVDAIVPPAAVPGWPARGSYDLTYGGGGDWTFPLLLLVGKSDARTSTAAVGKYVGESGALSVKAALEGYDSDAWDFVVVQSWEIDVITVAGVAYLAAEFTVRVVGSGAA